VAQFTVYRYGDFRSRQLVHPGQFVARRMTGYVDPFFAPGNDVNAKADQLVLQAADTVDKPLLIGF